MIPLQNPPEFSDGGYWVVIPVTAPDDDPGARSVDVPGSWAVRYSGESALVRTTTPVALNPGNPRPLQGKFRARLRGR